MSGIFGGGAPTPAPQPVPQPVPVNPVDDSAAQAKRLEAERAALADARSRGRQSTISAGGLTAEEEQQAKGLLQKQKPRSAAAKGLLG